MNEVRLKNKLLLCKSSTFHYKTDICCRLITFWRCDRSAGAFQFYTEAQICQQLFGLFRPRLVLAFLIIGFVPTEGLRWSESQHSVSLLPKARGVDRDRTVSGAGGCLPRFLPNPNTTLHPGHNSSWSRQRELLMHLLPWYTAAAAAAAAAQVQPGNSDPPNPPILSYELHQLASGSLLCVHVSTL